MFGHQDDQNNHHHDDNQPTDNVLGAPAADAILGDESNDNLRPTDHFNPALPLAEHDQPAPFTAHPTSNDTTAPAAASDDLLSIKQQALTQLTPIVDHLDQTPEEKFRTTMMMIQAADNKDLIKVAYDAAQAIGDEKVKAQALLDIVNEINYFTQHNA